MDLSKIDNIELAGVDHNDYPDYANAYIASADYRGKEMTANQLDVVNSYPDFVHEAVFNKIF